MKYNIDKRGLILFLKRYNELSKIAHKLEIDMDDIIDTCLYPTLDLEKDILIKEYKYLLSVSFGIEEDTEIDGQINLFEENDRKDDEE